MNTGNYPNNCSSSNTASSSGSSSSSSSNGRSNTTNEINAVPIVNLKIQKAEQRKRKWAELKSSDPAKYEQSLAKMRQYHQNTRDQRLAKQKQYRNNRTEEQKKIHTLKVKENARTQQQLMKDAETQLSNPTLIPTTTNIQELQRLADKRQHILANVRNYNNQSRRWAIIEQVWDEDYPCRYYLAYINICNNLIAINKGLFMYESDIVEEFGLKAHRKLQDFVAALKGKLMTRKRIGQSWTLYRTKLYTLY